MIIGLASLALIAPKNLCPNFFLKYSLLILETASSWSSTYEKRFSGQVTKTRKGNFCLIYAVGYACVYGIQIDGTRSRQMMIARIRSLARNTPSLMAWPDLSCHEGKLGVDNVVEMWGRKEEPLG